MYVFSKCSMAKGSVMNKLGVQLDNLMSSPRSHDHILIYSIRLRNLNYSFFPTHNIDTMAPSKRSSGKRPSSPTDNISEPKPKRVATSKPTTKSAPQKAVKHLALKKSTKRAGKAKIAAPEPEVSQLLIPRVSCPILMFSMTRSG